MVKGFIYLYIGPTDTLLTWGISIQNNGYGNFLLFFPFFSIVIRYFGYILLFQHLNDWGIICQRLIIKHFALKPIASVLGIPPENIFANQLLFKSSGEFLDFDANEPTSRSGGKAAAVQQIRKVSLIAVWLMVDRWICC